jgi:hypothetical protein
VHVPTEQISDFTQLVDHRARAGMFPDFARESCQAERERDDVLAHLVVQLPRNACPLAFLCGDQLPHQCLARVCKLVAFGRVRVHPNHAGEPTILTGHHRCGNRGPHHRAVNAPEPLLGLAGDARAALVEHHTRAGEIVVRDEIEGRTANQIPRRGSHHDPEPSIREHDLIVGVDDANAFVCGLDDLAVPLFARAQRAFSPAFRRDVGDHHVVRVRVLRRRPRHAGVKLNGVPAPVCVLQAHFTGCWFFGAIKKVFEHQLHVGAVDEADERFGKARGALSAE